MHQGYEIYYYIYVRIQASLILKKHLTYFNLNTV